MMFCEEIFRFLNLEETLYFTRLDVELNSLNKDITEKDLLEINASALSESFSCHRKGVKSANKTVAKPSDEEIAKIIEQTLVESKSINAEIYTKINDVLFAS